MSLTELFCEIDDFCQGFMPHWEQQLLTSGEQQRSRETQLSMSEIMTIVILFHQSGYRNFKTFYLTNVCVYLTDAFPKLVSYNRFI